MGLYIIVYILLNKKVNLEKFCFRIPLKFSQQSGEKMPQVIKIGV